MADQGATLFIESAVSGSGDVVAEQQILELQLNKQPIVFGDADQKAPVRNLFKAGRNSQFSSIIDGCLLTESKEGSAVEGTATVQTGCCRHLANV